MALKLTVPSVSSTPDAEVETRAVYVEEWIEALPYANPAVMVRQLLESVSKLNRCPLKPAIRLALMELYAHPYQYLMERQEQSDVAPSVAAFEKHRADSDAARLVAMEMGYGYKLVLAATVGRKGLFGKSKELATALQRAVLFLSFSLMHCYDEYLPAPSNLWRELCELYLYASRSRLGEQPVSAGKLRDVFQHSVAHTYKRMLLTSLVDPYHLTQGSIWKVFDTLGNYCDLAKLAPSQTLDKESGVFVVEPGRDQRPITYADTKGTGLSDEALVLDANPLIGRLQEVIKKSRAHDLDKRVLGRITRALGLPPKRHTPRERVGGKLELVSGLSAIHHFLGGADGAPRVAPPAVSRGEDDSIEIGDTAGEALSLSGPAYKTEAWELADKGPGGIGVLHGARPAIPIGVGQLLGIRFGSGRRSHWSVGVVRWLHIAHKDHYHAGVQVLAKAAQAVWIRTGDSGDEAGEGVAALVLPKLDSAKGSSVVAPGGTFTTGAMLSVQTPHERVTIRAGSLTESTESYDRFGFELVPG